MILLPPARVNKIPAATAYFRESINSSEITVQFASNGFDFFSDDMLLNIPEIENDKKLKGVNKIEADMGICESTVYVDLTSEKSLSTIILSGNIEVDFAINPASAAMVNNLVKFTLCPNEIPKFFL